MSTGTPAGWYPNPDGSGSNRYWDGTNWTDHIGPANTPPPPSSAPAPTYAPPTAVAATAPAPAKKSRKKWIIGGSIAAGVLLFGGIANAVGGGRDAAPQATVTVAAQEEPAEEPVVEPTPTEEPAEPSPTPTPTVAAASPTVFKKEAGGHLNDMLKDLEDIEVTVAEDGFWRLISNHGELSFNLGQLEVLDLPASMATSWPATLTDLSASLDAYEEALGSEDSGAILDAVAGIRAQVEVTREVARTAK